MPYIRWTEGDHTVYYETYCTGEQQKEHGELNANFRNARGIRRRIGNVDRFVSRWGYKKSFWYPMDDKAFGTLPKPLKFLGMNGITVFPGTGGAIHTRGLKDEYPEVQEMKLKYNQLVRSRAPWKRMTEKKFLVVFRNLGYAPCDYRWQK